MQDRSQYILTVGKVITFWRMQIEEFNDESYAMFLVNRLNIVHAIETGLNNEQTQLCAGMLLSQLHPFVERSANWTNYVTLLKSALSQISKKEKLLRVQLNNHLGYAFVQTQQYASATKVLNYSLLDSQSEDWLLESCDAYLYLGLASVLQTSFELAKSYSKRAHQLAKSHLEQNDGKLAAILNLMGLVEQGLGNYEYARDKYIAAAKCSANGTSVGVQHQIGYMLNAAHVSNMMEQHEVTFELCEQALHLLQDVNQWTLRTRVLILKGDAHFALQQYVEARDCYRDSYAEAVELTGGLYLQAFILSNLGNVYRKLCAFDECEPFLRGAIELWLSIGEGKYLGWTYGCLGKAKLAQGAKREATDLIGLALGELGPLKDDAWVCDYVTSLERITIRTYAKCVDSAENSDRVRIM